MGKNPSKVIINPAKTRRWTSCRQDPPDDRQKLDMRPTRGDRAANSETRPEDGAEVGVGLGREHNTLLSRSIHSSYLELGLVLKARATDRKAVGAG